MRRLLSDGFPHRVGTTYNLMASECFHLGADVSYPIGAAFAAAIFAVYLFVSRKVSKQNQK